MTKRTIKTCSVKTLAIFLSVLMIFYLIPETAYASLFEATEEESVVSETTEYIGEVFEDVSRREENVKHFRLEDGTYMAAQYDTAVHTLDENGKWQDIDNTLSDSGSEYSTSNARIQFAKKITGNESIFTLHENNRKITLSLDGAIKKTPGVAINTETEFDETATTLQKMMTLDKLSSRIIYEDILDGVDLEYIVVSNNVKENIIVKEQKDAYSYSFTLKLNNLSASLSSAGDVEITDPDSGAVLYIIPAPVVYDANMTYASETDAYYTLETIGQKEYRLTVTANTAWMNTSDRAFPVTIDPAIYYGGYGMQQMCDTCVSENYPTGVYGSRTYLKVGYDSANANLKAYVAMRSLPTLPAGSMITKAELNLTYNGTSEGISTANPLTLVAKKIIRSGYTSLWTESSTNYNTAMTYGDILDYRIISSASGDNVESWNITTAVVDWYADSTTNQGIAIMQYDMTDTTVHTVQFHSSDSSDLDDYYTPFFTIAYVSTIGIESYYSYQSISAGLAGTGYVNNATGALSFVKSLLSTTDSLLPYTVSMTYNSDFAGKAYQYSNAQTAYSTSYMPYGFKLNINETIIEKKYTNDTSGQSIYYIWSDADGTEHAFFPVYDTNKKEYVYVNEDGLQLTLNVTSSVCTITDDSKTVKTFTAMSSTPASDVYNAWYLTSISDKNGNTVSFSFDSSLRPTGVNLTPNGSSTISFLTLVYNDDGHLSMIRNDTSKEAIVFRYSNTYSGSIVTSGTNYLRQIVYAHGNSSVTTTNWTNFSNSSSNTTNITVDATATYTYDSAGQLTRVVDTLSGYRIDYTYLSGKVTVIQEYGSKDSSTFTVGQKIGLTYSTGYTEARISGTDDVYGNTDDIITRYVFDENGRAVGIYSTDSTRTIVYGASAGEYQEAEKVKNNLKTSTAVGGSATNYLLNGGFETLYSSLSAPHWETNSENIMYLSIENTLDSTYANFTPVANTTDTITQYTKLPVGTFTLSMSVSTVNCTNVEVFVDVTSSSADVSITKEIPINEYYASGVPSSFSMTFDNNVDNAIYSITIRVVGGSFTDTGKAVSIDNVMLEENIGNSAYSLVQIGNFDAFAVNSTGTATASVGTYWKTPSGDATAYNSQHSLFGNVGKVTGNINAENYIKQRVYAANDSVLDAYDNDAGYPDKATTFTLSAFALGTAQVPNENSKFRIRVNVYYYEGTGNANTVETKDFYFVNDYRDWQFVCGSFTTLPGKCVHYIDVICEYSYQPGGYALFDNIAVAESSDGNVIEYVYYDNSNSALEGLLRMQKSGYDAEYYEYNSDRMVTRIANNRGEIVDYTYAANGVDVENEIYYTFTYGDSSKIYPYLMEDPDSVITKTPKTKTTYSYNSYGQLTATRTMALQADLTRDTTVKYITTFTSYLTGTGSKLFGAIQSSTDNLGRETRYIYNTTSTYNFGDLMAVVNVSMGTGTCYTYDAIGNLLTVTPCTYTEEDATYTAVSGEENVTYGYATTDDPRNLLHSITTGSTTYTFTYDDFGNSNTISAGSRQLATYEYNSNNGKLNTITYGNGFTVKYVYDELDNVKEVWYNETKVYEYTYTAYGQVYRFDNLIDGTSTVYEYDPTGKLVHFTEFDSSAMVNKFSSLIYYDEEGKLKDYYFIGAYTNTSGVNDWSTYYYNDYLPDGRLNSFSLAADGDITTKTANATVNFTYDKYNRLEGKSYDFSASSQSFIGTTEYTFTETTAATSSQVATHKSTVNGTSVTSTYTYDDNGYITKIVLSTGAEYRYVYDDLGQLKREDNTVTGKTYVYDYDDAGNITNKTTYSLTGEGITPSVQISSVDYDYTDSLGWGDLLTSYDGVAIVYDDIGNPESYYNGASYAFEWENGRQLAKATLANTEITFTYNSEGIRTSKTINDEIVHKYHLSNTNIISEEWGTNLLVYLYESDGSPLGMQYRTSTMDEGEFYTFWFEKNLQGDIVAVYNSAGTKIISYTYDAWGNCATTYHSISGNNYYAVYNPFRYRGYYYDTELGFYYINSRYYDSSVGRFITADKFSTIKASSTELTDKNLYAYCDNNPVSRKDDGGTFWDTVFDVVSLAFSIADVVANPTDPLAWAGVVGDAIDLIPFVAGVGEVIKAVSASKKVVKKVGDAYEVAGSLRDMQKLAENAGESISDIKKLTGSYTIKYKGNHYYDGKGGIDRALKSAMDHSANGGKDIVSIQWRSASSRRQAFIEEYIRMCKHGGPVKYNRNSYNKIWSPGRKYFYQDTGDYFSFGGKKW